MAEATGPLSAEVYHCPALAARLSESQCKRNQELARKPRRVSYAIRRNYFQRNLASVRPCAMCPGVKMLGEPGEMEVRCAR